MSDPKPSRGMPRSLIYVLIPVGFAALVAFMVWGGNDEDLVEGGATPVVEDEG